MAGSRNLLWRVELEKRVTCSSNVICSQRKITPAFRKDEPWRLSWTRSKFFQPLSSLQHLQLFSKTRSETFRSLAVDHVSAAHWIYVRFAFSKHSASLNRTIAPFIFLIRGSSGNALGNFRVFAWCLSVKMPFKLDKPLELPLKYQKNAKTAHKSFWTSTLNTA